MAGRLAKLGARIGDAIAEQTQLALRRVVERRATAIIHRRVRGSYDAAQTHVDNKRHWAATDELSPNAANSATIRKTIRNRARYEIANSPVARGIVRTIAHDLIGRGPRLQLQTTDAELNRVLELHWSDWSAAIRLGAKLRTSVKAKVSDGESFGLLITNGKLDLPSQVDVRLIECERVCTPHYTGVVTDERKAVDGITFDEFGNPETYHVLQKHPGAADATGTLAKSDPIPAASMLHWFTAERPEQRRGVSDIMSSLSLFGQLRRFILATLTSAETAADLSIVMKTNAPAGQEAAEVDPWVTMDLEPNTAMFAPEGWEPSQLKAEHPNEVFAPFRRAIINEAGRPLSMPYNIAACDSSDYNYASGRLDHQTYFKAIDAEQGDLERVILDPLFAAWLYELLRNRYTGLGGQLERMRWPHEWIWGGREHVDPAKEAVAQDRRLKSLTTNLSIEYARGGLDWEEQLQQRAREFKLCEELGLPIPQPKTEGAF